MANNTTQHILDTSATLLGFYYHFIARVETRRTFY
jgi:hypothetical protein